MYSARKSGNVNTRGPRLQCVWFECDANNAIGTLSIPHECRFDHRVSPHAIPNTCGMTGDMLSFHEFLQYFCWHCGNLAQVVQTIVSIIWMANRKEVGDHVFYCSTVYG